MSEHEVRIGHLNLEKCNFVDIIKELENKIGALEKEILKRDTWNIELQGDILLLKEEIVGKNDML